MNRRKRTQFWGANKDDDRLVRAILSGHKTATVCKADEYYTPMGEFDDGGMEVGDLIDVFDLQGRARCVIRITEVYPVRFGEIPGKLWRGEGCTSAEDFRAAHRRSWPQYSLTDDFELIATHFELVTPPMKKSGKRIPGLAGWLAASFVAAALGAIASVHAAGFYAQLARPAWAPPGSVFGPVWSVLYTLMGVSAWLVWKESGFKGAAGALGLYIAQLVANALWSWLFFAWHLGGAAFVEILVLWLLILANVIGFGRRSRLAAALLLPYLAWVTFAAVLCFATWKLNPARL